ncbi:MAG: hypothetical protein AAB296_02080, partial [Candidatus Desantisbacteria bacterium]
MITVTGYGPEPYCTQLYILVPKVTPIPASGPVGTIVTLIGKGYYWKTTGDGGNNNIEITFGTSAMWGPIGDEDVSSNGTFSATFILDTQPGGITVITTNALPNGELDATTTFYITGDITYLAPTSGTIGTTVTVIGTGYWGSETVRISFGSVVTITTTISSTNGTFSTTFTINTQPYSSQIISAYDPTTTNLDTTVFFIHSWITLVTPTTGKVYSYVTVEGMGYSIGQVDISFGKVINITTTTAGINGTFSTSFYIDLPQKSGTTTITSTGTNGEFDADSFIIIGGISIGPNSGIVGSMVTVGGTGYIPGALTQIDFGTHETITTTIASSPDGTFSVTFIIDTQPEGTRWIVASDGNPANTDTLPFIILPNIITMTPLLGVVGTVVTIEGTGYQYGTVTIHFGTRQTITTVVSSGNGTFSTTFAISPQPTGTKKITAVSLSSRFASTSFAIYSNIILVTPLSGFVGRVITVWGDGFDGTGSLVGIDFGTKETITTTITGQNGTFSVTFLVNTQPTGTKWITACTTNEKAGTYVYEIHSEITLVNPPKGAVGKEVTVTGTGFDQDGTVTIHFGTKETITTIGASHHGTFSLTFIVNTQGWGTKKITACTQNEQALAEFLITGAYITLVAPTQGSVATQVTVTGIGFDADGTVTIDFGTHQTITTAQVQPDGTFSVTFLVSTQSWGIKGITASTTNEQNINADRFDVVTTYLITDAYI